MTGNDRETPKAKGRAFVGITFECCSVYRRIYLNADQSAFAGACPKCGKPVRIRVGPGGSKSRFWSVG